MRRALGLRDDTTADRPSRQGSQGSQGERRPRRFVRDGEVPVVVLKGHGHEGDAQHSVQERLKAAEAALEAERSTREAAERRVQELRTQIQSVQTKEAHAAITHAEALAAERQAREAAERALEEALAGRAEAERTLAGLQDTPAVPAEPKPARRRGRPPGPARQATPKPEREPEPVKWWLPSYRKKR